MTAKQIKDQTMRTFEVVLWLTKTIAAVICAGVAAYYGPRINVVGVQISLVTICSAVLFATVIMELFALKKNQ